MAARRTSACSACRPARGWSGPDAARAILQRYPGTKVLVLLEVTDQETLAELKRSGVGGVTHQDQSVAQIASALDAIEAGRNVLDPGPLRAPARGAKRMCELSPREREIVARIVGGQSTRQMSFAMNITVDTVRTYVKNVLAKLGAHSRLQLAALASREGLLIDQATAADSPVPRMNGSAAPTAGRCLRRGREPGDGDGARAHHLCCQGLAFSSLTGISHSATPWGPGCRLSRT